MGYYSIGGLGEKPEGFFDPVHADHIWSARWNGACSRAGYDCVNLTQAQKDTYTREEKNFQKILYDMTYFQQLRGRNDRDRVVSNCKAFLELWKKLEKSAAIAEGRPVGDPNNILMQRHNPASKFYSLFGCLPPNVKHSDLYQKLVLVPYPPGINPEKLQLKDFISEEDLPPLPVAVAVEQPPTVTAPPVEAPIYPTLPVPLPVAEPLPPHGYVCTMQYDPVCDESGNEIASNWCVAGNTLTKTDLRNAYSCYSIPAPIPIDLPVPPKPKDTNLLTTAIVGAALLFALNSMGSVS